MTPKAAMVAFILRGATDDVAGSPPGVEAHGLYEGPHGPAYAGYSDDGLVTRAWGPHLPDGRFEIGRAGRLDGKRHTSLVDPVPVFVGAHTGEAVQLHSAVFSRRRRGIVVNVGERSYLYRHSGYASSLLEREDRTPVAIPRGPFRSSTIAEAADAFDLAVFLVMCFAVPFPA